MIEKAVDPEIVDHDGNGQSFIADHMKIIAALSLTGLAGAALYYQLNSTSGGELNAKLTEFFKSDPDFVD